MHQRRARILTPLAILALLAALPRPVAATPPRPPLELVLRLLEDPVPGRPVRYAIEVTPLVPVERLRIRVLPPRGVELASGDTATTVRDVPRGQARRFEGSLRVPPGRRHWVRVSAEATTSSGHTWTRGEHLVILAGPLAVPDPPQRVVPDGRGGSVVEFDGTIVRPAR